MIELPNTPEEGIIFTIPIFLHWGILSVRSLVNLPRTAQLIMKELNLISDLSLKLWLSASVHSGLLSSDGHSHQGMGLGERRQAEANASLPC